jgi:phage gpG-like protein
MQTIEHSQTFSDLANDLAETMPEVAELMLASVQKNFDVGGRPRSWLPTRAGNSPLRGATGKLFSSIRASSGSNWAEVGTTGGLPYTRIHQFGGHVKVSDESRKFFWAMFFQTKDPKWKYMAIQKKSKMRIDKRPYMMLQKEDIEQIKEMVRRSIRLTGPELKQ